MKISNKIHRGAGIAAAVILLVTLLISTASQAVTLVMNGQHYDTTTLITTLVNLTINIMNSVLLVVVLFRGKKDTLSGALMLVTALIILGKDVTGGIATMFSYASTRAFLQGDMFACFMAAAAIRLIGGITNVAFRVFLALECLKPGNISGSKLKVMLIILPVVVIMLTAFSTMVQSFYMVTDYGFGEYLLPMMVAASVTAVLSIGNVITGLALSIPVYEKTPFSYDYGTEPRYNYY